MTDAQRVQLIRDILEQSLKGQLGDAEALAAIHLVLDPGPLTYAEVAREVRWRIAHLGDPGP